MKHLLSIIILAVALTGCSAQKRAEEGNRDDTIVFRKYAGSGVFELVVEINRKEKRLEGRSFRIMRH